MKYKLSSFVDNGVCNGVVTDALVLVRCVYQRCLLGVLRRRPFAHRGGQPEPGGGEGPAAAWRRPLTH